MTNDKNFAESVIPPGTKVRYHGLAEEDGGPEVGLVIHCWMSDEFNGYDCYVAFFGRSFPEGQPTEIPYVLRYASTSLEIITE